MSRNDEIICKNCVSYRPRKKVLLFVPMTNHECRYEGNRNVDYITGKWSYGNCYEHNGHGLCPYFEASGG
jgi:hypothetical protein